MARLGRGTPFSHALTNWQQIGPVALEGPQPPVPVVTDIATPLVAVSASRRATRPRAYYNLSRPVVVLAPDSPTQQQQTIKTTLAGRSRVELGRRALAYANIRASHGGPVSSYSSVVLASAPDAFYLLDDTGGTAADASGNAHTGTYVGSSFSQNQGALNIGDGTSVRFADLTGYIDMGAGYLPTQSAPFTVEAWIKSLTTANQTRRYISRGTQGAAGWAIGITNAGHGLCFTSYGINSGISSYLLTPGFAHHVVFQFKTDNSVDLYVDGTFRQNLAGIGPITASADHLLIGRAGGAGDLAWDGWVDGVAYYTRTLTAAEITAHYNAGSQFVGVQRARNFVGVYPPLTLTPSPSLAARTIKTTLAGQAVPRRGTHSVLRTVVITAATSVAAPIAVSLAAVRSELNFLRRKPLSALRPPATLEPYAVQLEEETVKVALVQTRPRHTLTRLLPPATLEAASTQLQERTLRAKLARIRPVRTRAKVAPPATLEPYSVALEERTIKSSLAQTRPRPTTAYLSPPATLEPESVQLEEETIKASLARIRPVPTTRVLRPPATLEPASVALAERTIRIRLARIRPKPKTARLQPPTTLQVFFGPVVHLVQTRPRPIRSRLEPPTALKTFSGFPATTVVTRPPKTISGFTRTPLTVPAVTAIRTRLARARPQPTAAFVAPPATLESESIQDRERRITTLLVRTRPRPTTTNLAPPATLEPYAVEQRERTITVWLTRLFRRPTHARLAPPIFYAATSAIRVALGGRTRAEAARRAPHYKLRPPTVVIVPSVEQREETILVVLAEFVRRLVRPRLRPPTVTAPAETKIRVRLAPARRPKPESRLTPPTVVNERAEAPIVKPIVKLVAVAERGSRVRRGPTSRLVPPGPPRIKGVACLIDLPANLACLVDQLAAAACLANQLAAEGCLGDGAAAQGCLTDKGAACAILSEE